jgi:hypothetical protein
MKSEKEVLLKPFITEVQKLNQGSLRKTGCISFSGGFFVYFFSAKKVKGK